MKNKSYRELIIYTTFGYKSKVISFADFRKVFDSIYDGKMLRIFKMYNIGEKRVNTIAKIYKTT